MGIVLAFAPFIGFALVDRFFGSLEGLAAGAAISLALIAREVMAGRSPKVLEVGSAVLFGGLALYTWLAHPDWSIVGVRLRVDVGLLAIVLISMAMGKPFTSQYAREQVSEDLWTSRTFVQANYVITAAWALAFALLVVADLIWLFMPELPPRVGLIITIAALVGAIKFTGWYPSRVSKAA